jgi:RNA polymerase sigma-70 factor (ECF subfamily)
MAHVAGTEAAEAALMKALYDEHAAVLWRYAMRLTGDASPAEDVVQETLLRAWQDPEFVGDAESSARAWLFTVARNMIIDERRSARFRYVVSSLDDLSTPEQSAPDEVNAALDRMLIADAMTQLSAEHRAVIERSYYRGWTTAQIDADLGIAEVPITLCRAGTPTYAARDGGDTMTAIRPIRAPIGPECQMVPGDWLDTKTTLQAIRAAVGPVDLMMLSGDGLSS